MLVIALIAVSLGVWREAPGLIVVFAVPAVIALVRTVLVSDDRDSTFRHLSVFMVTFAVVIGVAVAGWVAFCATCLATACPPARENFGGEPPTTGPDLRGWDTRAVAVMVGLTMHLFLRARRRKQNG